MAKTRKAITEAGPTKVELAVLVSEQKAKIEEMEKRIEGKEKELAKLVGAKELSGAADVLGLQETMGIAVPETEAITILEMAGLLGGAIIEMMGSKDWRQGLRGCHSANKMVMIGALILLRQLGLLGMCGLQPPMELPETLKDYIGDNRKGAAQTLGRSRARVA